TGCLSQTPPAYSAKKIGGVRSHDSARRGGIVVNPPVQVARTGVALTQFREPDPSTIGFHVVCGGGTYVRSLAHDLGQRLGCGAHLNSLRRLRSGEFDIVHAVAMDSTRASDVTPVEQLFLYYPARIVSGLEERR